MTIFHHTEREMAVYVLNTSAWLTVGALIGALHFMMLRWNVRNFEVGRSLVLAFATQIVRFALVAVVLGVIARQFGALPLLIATAGILVARTVIIRFGLQS